MKYRRELEVIHSILKSVIQQMREQRLSRLTGVNIAIGEIVELDRYIIQSHWNDLSRGTPAEHAELNFRLIEAEVQCMSCFEKYHPEGGVIFCPYCGSFGAKILAGEECYLESVE